MLVGQLALVLGTIGSLSTINSGKILEEGRGEADYDHQTTFHKKKTPGRDPGLSSKDKE